MIVPFKINLEVEMGARTDFQRTVEIYLKKKLTIGMTIFRQKKRKTNADVTEQ